MLASPWVFSIPADKIRQEDTMKDLMPYLPYAVIFIAVLFGIVLVFWRKQSLESRRKNRAASLILEKIAEAQLQRELFNVEIMEESEDAAQHKGFVGALQRCQNGILALEVLSALPSGYFGKTVCVYFRLKSNNTQNFFRFTSRIEALQSKHGVSTVCLAIPECFEGEQKRNFYRVQPLPGSVRALGLWELNASQPMPETTADLKRPLCATKEGIAQPCIQLDNVSASGIALSMPINHPDGPAPDLTRGTQILCLIAFRYNGSLLTFWCTGEIVNSRDKDNGASRVYGIEFTNWAILQNGQSAFNWFHASPVRGIPIISQWVDSMDTSRGGRPVETRE